MLCQIHATHNELCQDQSSCDPRINSYRIAAEISSPDVTCISEYFDNLVYNSNDFPDLFASYQISNIVYSTISSGFFQKFVVFYLILGENESFMIKVKVV